jgi:hypothetical protein
MRARILAVAVVLLLVVAVVVAVSPAQAPGTETILMKVDPGRNLKIVFVPRGQSDSPGTVRLQRDALFDPATDVWVGNYRSVCTVYFGPLPNRKMLCTDQIAIPGRGGIQVEGVAHLGPAPDELVVVGGTGDFVDVGGTMDRANTREPTITLHLIYH